MQSSSTTYDLKPVVELNNLGKCLRQLRILSLIIIIRRHLILVKGCYLKMMVCYSKDLFFFVICSLWLRGSTLYQPLQDGGDSYDFCGRQGPLPWTSLVTIVGWRRIERLVGFPV